MFALGKAITRSACLTRNMVFRRYVAQDGIPGPPLIRISLQEKLITGLIMSVCFLAYPSYCLVMIKHWRPKLEEEAE